MRVAFATDIGSAPVNQDWVGATTNTVVVLDGISSPSSMDSGCLHDVAWYVQHLGTQILALSQAKERLTETLATAIDRVASMHSETCDVHHPGSPSTTVAIFRNGPLDSEYLVLSDATIVVEDSHGVRAITDDAVEKVAIDEIEATRAYPTGSVEHRKAVDRLIEVQRELRNTPDGYWVAAGDPAAATHALTGTTSTADLRRIALMTDGAARMVEPFARWSWPKLLDVLDSEGPSGLIRRTRTAEDRDPKGQRWPRYKRHDDATVAYCVMADQCDTAVSAVAGCSPS